MTTPKPQTVEECVKNIKFMFGVDSTTDSMEDELKCMFAAMYEKGRAEQREKFKILIKESFWQCSMHEKLQVDGSCKDCDECLGCNVILSKLLESSEFKSNQK